VGAPGGPILNFFVACTSNTGPFTGSPRPDFAAIKAATPPGGTITQDFGAFGDSYRCMGTKQGIANILANGSRSGGGNLTYTYSEITWNSTLWTAWTGEYSNNADFCYMRGGTVPMGECVLGYSGSLPPGLMMVNANNITSSVHGAIGTYTCP
jgi:hypothetical protein